MSEEFESDVDSGPAEDSVESSSSDISVDTSPDTSPDIPSNVDDSPALDLTGVIEDVPDSSVVGEYDTPAPEQPNAFLDSVRGAGLEADTTEDAQSVLLQSYRNAQNYAQQQAYQQQVQQQAWQQQQMQQQHQMQQMQHMAQMGQQLQSLSEDDGFQSWVNDRAEQVNNDSEPEHWWSPPAVSDQEMQAYRTPVQTGNGWEWGWKHNTPRELIERADNYIQYHDKWTEDLTRRPQEVLPRIIEQEFDKLFVDRYGSLLQEAKSHQESQAKENHIRGINDRNADWIYQTDPTTGQKMRDQTGRTALTPEGQQVIGYINQLRQGGMQDPDQLWQTATQMLAGQMASTRLGEMQQQMSTQQSTQDRNVRHLQRGAGYIPNRGGSVAPPENPSPNSQNQHLSAGDKLRQQALSDGLF